MHGTISVTTNGGKTWRVVLRTLRPIVAVEYFHDGTYARADDGQTYAGDSNGRGWQRRSPLSFHGYCPHGWHAGFTADAFTPFTSHAAYGGISLYGYPAGISGSHGGLGIIWESRGTLYLTHDGGHHWHALPKVARPEIDFGDWADADVYPQGTAFVLLSYGGSQKRRLIETTDAGRTWRIVRRWG